MLSIKQNWFVLQIFSNQKLITKSFIKILFYMVYKQIYAFILKIMIAQFQS